MPNFVTWLQNVWRERRTGESARAEAQWYERRHLLRLPVDLSVAEEFSAVFKAAKDPRAAADFVVLGISFAGREGERTAAEARLAELGSLLRQRGMVPTYHFEFTRALYAFYRGDYVGAAPAFAAAAERADSAWAKAYALLNEVLCLENLGYPSSAPARALQAILTVTPPDEQWARPVRAQLQDQRFREAWRALDDRKLHALAAEGKPAPQLAFHFGWLQRLPHFAWPLTEDFRGVLATSLGAYQAGYLLRSLDAFAIAGDLAPGLPIPDQIERLYLWTWRWLCSPRYADAERLAQLAHHLLAAPRAGLIGEDLALFECALRWIALFLGWQESTAPIRLRREVAPHTHQALAIDYERVLLDFCFARRDGDTARARTALQTLQMHPAARAEWFRLPSLVRQLTEQTSASEPLASLARSLASLFHQAPPAHGYVADLASGRLIRYREGVAAEESISPSVVQLLHAFNQKPEWHAAELLGVCFGLPVYDSTVHDPKLAKLVMRARRFCGDDLTAVRRGEYHTGHWQSSVALRFRSDTPQTRSLTAVGAAEKVFASAPPAPAIQPAPVRRQALSAAQWFTRRELQDSLGCPRSTLLRQLREWSRDGKLESQGRGKASRYRFSKNLPPEMKGLFARFS